MSEESIPKNEEIENNDFNESQIEIEQHSNYKIPTINDDKRHLSSMFRTWFLDYASYVNLERAIPHINDGLKPVQRRVLYAMRRMEDGRYNKVAGIIGNTMHFHPHGDASIGDALVNLGQKNLLIDCQGNWGNILTGDSAAAPRYIEARLSKFAIDAVFNSKTTEWKPSYDGRNQEPISLPVKFPLLLAQGSEGIGLGLNSKILPHNFGELCEASISLLKNEPFELFPDFPTGGMLDISKYNDGERGGKIIIRAKIEKIDNKTLKITEIPYGITTSILIESIIKANEKGKINIKKVEDNTSKNVEIRVHLEAKTSSDKTIDALYAFTKCQVSYSPNCCVIDDNKPCFISVSEVLKRNTSNTIALLKKELEIEKEELTEMLHFSSLEKIFIEERIYKDKEFENATSTDIALSHIEKRLESYKELFIRAITHDDLLKLLDIKMARILKFNINKAEESILALKAKIQEIDYKLTHIIEHTINWFLYLEKKYASLYPRQTELRNFEIIQAAKVVEANEKLYVNKEEGFVGYGIKKDENVEFISNCSDIDDIIIFFKDGKYKIVKIAEKLYVGKNILHVAVFIKNDKRTIYNVVYRNGKNGDYYIKRFAVYGITRDKEYDCTQGTNGSKVIYFSANPNGEAETIKIALKPTTRRIKNLVFEKNFSEIGIKGRQSIGNILTKFDIHKILLKHKGVSTLGGSDIWFDRDVFRLNSDKRGEYLGNFNAEDQILIITSNGEYYTTNFDLTNHYDEDIRIIEKYDSNKVWSVALYDSEQGYSYIKRFQLEPTNKRTSFIQTGGIAKMLWITDVKYPHIIVKFGGHDNYREPLDVDVADFIGIKSYKAKGKRISNYSVDSIEELAPFIKEEHNDNILHDEKTIENDINESIKNDDTSENHENNDSENDIDEITGQMSLF